MIKTRPRLPAFLFKSLDGVAVFSNIPPGALLARKEQLVTWRQRFHERSSPGTTSLQPIQSDPKSRPRTEMAAALGNIVVTGASSGVGRACALRWDARGGRVFAGVRQEADAESLRRDASDRLVPVMLDVTDASQIAVAAESIHEAVADEGLQGLVNNAGVAIIGCLETIPLQDLRRQFEVNVFGHVAVTQAMLPMLREGRGRVVNVSSIAGKFAGPFFAPYAASNHALEAISDSLRQELRPCGISVSVIEPGVVSTRMVRQSPEHCARIVSEMDSETRERYADFSRLVEKNADKIIGAGIPPERVAAQVEHALTSWWPKTRYLVGIDARTMAFLRWTLPDRALDWFLRKAMGLK
ncbi:MAG: SDR family oxidoreductase [Planctomycetales bacterium]